MKKIDRSLYHELLDRTLVIINILDDAIGNHKALTKNKKYKKLYKKSEKALNNLYQLIGKHHLQS